MFWAAASQRKAAASMAAEALGGQREGRAPRLGLVWGAMGERKPFVKQVSSTLESLPPLPGVAVTPVAFLAMPADTLLRSTLLWKPSGSTTCKAQTLAGRQLPLVVKD